MTTTKTFAARVLTAAAKIGRPGTNVAIFSIYSAYGVDNADAGSLESFKSRLVAAAKARDLDLARCDMVQALGRELRDLSATQYGGEDLHYVETPE